MFALFVLSLSLSEAAASAEVAHKTTGPKFCEFLLEKTPVRVKFARKYLFFYDGSEDLENQEGEDSLYPKLLVQDPVFHPMAAPGWLDFDIEVKFLSAEKEGGEQYVSGNAKFGNDELSQVVEFSCSNEGRRTRVVFFQVLQEDVEKAKFIEKPIGVTQQKRGRGEESSAVASEEKRVKTEKESIDVTVEKKKTSAGPVNNP